MFAAIVHIDETINRTIAGWHTPFFDRLFLYITYLGNVQTILILTLILLCLLWYLKKQKLAVLFIAGLVAGESTALVIKNIFERARPLDPFIDSSHLGYSFPSAHALVATIFYGFAAYCFFHTHANKFFRTSISVGALVIILAIGFSRLYLGVHWFSDVIAGWFFGALILRLLIYGFTKAHKKLSVTH